MSNPRLLAPGGVSWGVWLQRNRVYLLCAVILVAMSCFAPRFLTTANVTSILKTTSVNAYAAIGFSDFWRLRWLILRSAMIGVFGGFVPAVGASASTWIAYAHSMRSAKDKSRFGHGEIRGIAAAEGANNATMHRRNSDITDIAVLLTQDRQQAAFPFFEVKADETGIGYQLIDPLNIALGLQRHRLVKQGHFTSPLLGA